MAYQRPSRPRGFAMRRHADKITDSKFAHVIRQFLLSEKFKRLSDSTRYGYRRTLAIAERALGAVDVSEIDSYLVQAFLDGLADRPGVQTVAKVSIKAVERWALVRRLLPRPITIGCEVVGSDGAREPWSDAEVMLAEAHARPDLARVVTLGSHTGQRAIDLCNMRWSDLRTYKGHEGIDVVQQKTKRKLWVPLTGELERAMATWPKTSIFILTSHKGAPWKRPTLSHEWGRERRRNEALAALEERKLSLHGLRATAVVRLRRAGVSRPLIGDLVGMSSAMVDRYCRRSDQSDNALAALEMMERTQGEQARIIPFKRAT
jgi:integrase